MQVSCHSLKYRHALAFPGKNDHNHPVCVRTVTKREVIMPRMKSAKRRIEGYLTSPDWRERLEEISHDGLEAVGPLFSFLPRGGLLMHRAAVALGKVTALLALQRPDAARNILRRLMWHMSEESGNMGWGIPEAFGEILAASPPLAKEFHRILLSYIIDLGHDDNYCDNDILRRSCYWAIGRLAGEHPALCQEARPWLRRGLDDQDSVCQGMAAWALGQLPVDVMDVPALRRLSVSANTATCEFFDGTDIRQKTAAQIATEVLARHP